jgi:predicted HAD superfamily phosphohydrolase YqeG
MLCGDQLFTDMPAGNLCGIKTLLVTPAQLETGWTFRLRRRLEQPLLRKYIKGEVR